MKVWFLVSHSYSDVPRILIEFWVTASSSTMPIFLVHLSPWNLALPAWNYNGTRVWGYKTRECFCFHFTFLPFRDLAKNTSLRYNVGPRWSDTFHCTYAFPNFIMRRYDADDLILCSILTVSALTSMVISSSSWFPPLPSHLSVSTGALLVRSVHLQTMHVVDII